MGALLNAVPPIKTSKEFVFEMRIIMFNKKLHVLAITFFVSLVFCLFACTTKMGPIGNLADLTEEVQANGSNYSAEDWKAVSNELDAIENEIEQYRDEYTDEELKEIGRLKGILLAQYTKYSIKSIKGGAKNAITEAEGLIDGFLNSFSSDSSQ